LLKCNSDFTNKSHIGASLCEVICHHSVAVVAHFLHSLAAQLGYVGLVCGKI